VTGAGLDTETLVLRLAPDAVIAGKVLDESNEPVRHAHVTLYYTITALAWTRSTSFAPRKRTTLGVRTYTAAARHLLFVGERNALVRHSSSFRNRRVQNQQVSNPTHADSNEPVEAPPTVDRSLDVAYPVNLLPGRDRGRRRDADTDPRWRASGGRHPLESDPVPAAAFSDAGTMAEHGFTMPQLEQPAFDGSTLVPGTGRNRRFARHR